MQPCPPVSQQASYAVLREEGGEDDDDVPATSPPIGDDDDDDKEDEDLMRAESGPCMLAAMDGWTGGGSWLMSPQWVGGWSDWLAGCSPGMCVSGSSWAFSDGCWPTAGSDCTPAPPWDSGPSRR